MKRQVMALRCSAEERLDLARKYVAACKAAAEYPEGPKRLAAFQAQLSSNGLEIIEENGREILRKRLSQ